MYRPTASLHELHREHKKLILRTTKDATDQEHGAIHLRFGIMRTSFPKESEGTVAIYKALHDLAGKLYDCLQLVHEKQEGQGGAAAVEKWWLVTDKLTYGQNLTIYVNELATNASSSYQPQLFLETSQAEKEPTHPIIQKIASHRQNGEIAHSMDGKATGPMGHDCEFMASSMLDWMALHESKLTVSLITSGAFAGTGAKGNGKYIQKLTDAEQRICSMFQL